MPEKLLENAGLSERGPEKIFGKDLNDLGAALGPELPSIPEKTNQKQLEEEERKLLGDNSIGDFSELFRVSELQQRRHSLQREAKLKSEKTPSPENRNELMLTEQAATYHEYFPAVIHDLQQTMRRYETLRSTMPTVSNDLNQKEQQARLYMHELSLALRERTAFGNVLLIDNRLSRNDPQSAVLLGTREKLLADPLMRNSTNALGGSQEAKWRRAYALNQRIVDLLSGAAKAPGIEKDFLPQQLYLQLLREKYEQLLAEQKRLTKDRKLEQSIARRDELEKKSQLSEKNQGPPITEQEFAEYERLQIAITDRNGTLSSLSAARKEITQEMVSTTNRLVADHMDRAKLSTIQHEFGNQFEFEGVSPPNPLTSPKDLQAVMGKQMEQRSQFHLQRMDGYLGRMDKDVLTTGVKEWTEHISNKNGREVVKFTNQIISRIITSVLPDTLDLKNKAYQSLTGPLNEALGWPPGKEKWEDLTPKEQEKVLKRSESIKDAVNAFDRTKIENLQSTIHTIQAMPEASTFAGQDVFEPLPTIRVTPENREQLISQIGGPTVYMMLFRQMDEDWGSQNPPSGYMGELSGFMNKVNSNIDVHIDVGEQLFRLQNNYDDLKKYLFYAALAIFAAGLAIGFGALKLVRPMAKGAWNTMRFGARMTKQGVEASGRVVGNTSRQLAKLLSRTKTPPPGSSGLQKAAEGAAKGSKIGRILGPIGIVLTAFDLRRVMQRDARLEELKEYDGIQAAIELMENHGNKKAFRYKEELSYLRDRIEALRIQQNSIRIAQELQKRFPSGNPEADKLKEKAEALYRFAGQHKERFKNLFPVTDYLVTDPQREAGNVGVNIRHIDDARIRGHKFEQENPGRGFKLSLRSETKKSLLDVDFAKVEALKKEKGGAEKADTLMREQMGLDPRDPKEFFTDLKSEYGFLESEVADFLAEQQ